MLNLYKLSIAETIPGSYRPNRTRPKIVITKLFVTTSTPKIKSGFCEIDTFKLHYYDHQYLFEYIFWSSYGKWRKAKVDMNNSLVILLLVVLLARQS